jgi:hypothetical protein
MKKTVLILPLAFISWSAIGQITINSNDVLDVQQYVDRAYDFNPSIVHSPGGADQTWNFGMLLNQDDSELFGFGVASWYDGHQNFPDANLGTTDQQSGWNTFARKDNDAIDVLGVYGDLTGGGNNSAIAITPYDRIIQFPASFGSEYNSDYSIRTSFDGSDFGLDSIVVEIDVVKNVEFDAWGEITTPFGTFQTIRQYVHEITTTDITGYTFGFPAFQDESTEETHQYLYWTNDPISRFVVLEYTYDPITDLVEDVIWQRSSPVLSLDEESADVQVKVYPNPATEFITIDTDIHAANYAIVDLMGKKVTAGTVDNHANKINVSGLNAGTYVLQLQDQNQKTVAVRRIVLK